MSDRQPPRRVVRALVAVLTGALLLTPGAALAGSSDSGGPWQHSVYIGGGHYVTCTFSGNHTTDSSGAYATTSRAGSNCDRLRVRMKWNYQGNDVEGQWFQTSLSSITVYAADSTAVSSEHRARNVWSATWSATRRPHAW